MSEYQDFLPELKTTTLFQNIEDRSLIALLDVMRPEIVRWEAGKNKVPQIDIENGMFCIVLRGKPLDQLEPRMDVYNMPKFGEPGIMMGEIPCLSEMNKSKAPRMRFRNFLGILAQKVTDIRKEKQRLHQRPLCR